MTSIYPFHRSPGKSRPILLPLFGSVVVLNLFVITLLGLWQYQSWQQYRDRAMTLTENLSRTLEHDILDNIGMVDIALLAVAREKSLHPELGRVDLSAFNPYFQLIRDRIPELYAVRVTDAHGRIIGGSDEITMSPQSGDLSNRDYFIEARDNPKAGLVISKPLIGATSHKWSLVFARRLNDPDGSFSGIAYGAMILERYLNLFAGVDLGKDGIVALRDEKLNLIVRQPSIDDPVPDTNRRAPPGPLRQLVESGLKAGHYESISPVDRVRRIGYFHQVGEFPLYIVIAVGKDDAFTGWRRDLYRVAGVAALFTLASFLLAQLYLRSWCRQVEISQRALEANRQLEESLAALRDRDEDLKATQEVGKLGVFSRSFETDALLGSEDLRTLFGLLPDDPVSIPRWLEIIHPDDKVRMSRFASFEARSLQTQFSEEYRVVRPIDGEVAWMQVIGKVERDATGKPLRVRGAIQDITERRLAEQAIQRMNEELEDRVRQRTAQLEAVNQDLIRARDAADEAARAKAEFLANMSHEIRTPMNAAIGFAHLAMATEMTARQRDYIGKIMTAARSLLRIINDILDFSKIDAGKLSLEQTPFRLDQVIGEVRDILAVMVAEKSLEMRLSQASDVPNLLIGDAARLHQVLLNLLSNAVKFTDDGVVELSVRVTNAEGDQVTLRFDVVDSGIGLSEDHQRRLFTPFDQADSSITRRYGGTGLGLAIVRRLIALMGGSIGVESRLGEGARFWCTAKFGIADADQQPSVPTPVEPGLLRNLAGARVLVVEDNEINRMVTQGLLEQAGIVASFAENGVEGVKAVLENGPFDAVLMDVQMPQMDGFTATRRIRADPVFADLPIIALTANAMKGDRDAALESGMNDYIAKPVDPDQALLTLGRWIKLETLVGTSGGGVMVGSAVAILDRAAGLRRVGGNQALYEKILTRLSQDARHFPEQFAALRSAGDAVSATRLVHSLKSSAGAAGADELQSAAALIERYCRDGAEEFDRLAVLLSALEKSISRLLQELEG